MYKTRMGTGMFTRSATTSTRLTRTAISLSCVSRNTEASCRSQICYSIWTFILLTCQPGILTALCVHRPSICSQMSHWKISTETFSWKNRNHGMPFSAVSAKSGFSKRIRSEFMILSRNIWNDQRTSILCPLRKAEQTHSTNNVTIYLLVRDTLTSTQ